ncbi:S1 family peptidase [Paraglaciecola aestuariivivens]
MFISKNILRPLFSAILLTLAQPVFAHSVTDVVARVKPSVVGIGLYDALAAQSHQLRGTGFVFGDGSLIATNHHVIAQRLDPQKVQYHIVFAGIGRTPNIFRAKILASDPSHDLAILKIEGKLKPVTLAFDEYVKDATAVLLTGFPIGAVLGLYPATHRGIVAATTPDATPSQHSSQLTVRNLNRLDQSFMIYQLDMTAYPGNSGSPLYDAHTGQVVGILNKVFVKESKETLLQKPSGISYAIPVKYLRQLALAHGIEVK